MGFEIGEKDDDDKPLRRAFGAIGTRYDVIVMENPTIGRVVFRCENEVVYEATNRWREKSKTMHFVLRELKKVYEERGTRI